MRQKKRFILLLLLSLTILLTGLTGRVAHADIAPPDFPTGANPIPETDSTQVRMLAETVTIELLSSASPYAPVSPAMAQTTAVFRMQNMSSVAESMLVRFPLTYWGRHGDPYEAGLEIRNLAVKVDGKSVAFERVMAPGEYYEADIPWAAFNVNFQPAQPVEISVSYQSDATGELTYAVFRYTLATGAGWKDTIGSVDIIVRLPYPASEENVVLDPWVGFGEPTPGATFSGNEARWHFDELEPGYQDNFMAILLTPVAWKRVLLERQNTTQNPNDGEAWGRLGKACKESIYLRKGLRTDPGGLSLYEEAVQAYERSLELLPSDSLWHYGYAELLWNQYYWNVYWSDPTDVAVLVQALQHLQTALQIDPSNQRARDLLDEIRYTVPEYVRRDDSGRLDLLVLTATPLHVTLTPWPSETPYPSATLPPTQTSPSSATPLPATVTSTTAPATSPAPAQASPTTLSQPAAAEETSGWGSPRLCGSAFLLPALLGLVLLRRRK
jgi:tetratricopeptide (TPR) repeat protein